LSRTSGSGSRRQGGSIHGGESFPFGTTHHASLMMTRQLVKSDLHHQVDPGIASASYDLWL
jgi:hypothetical protein